MDLRRGSNSLNSNTVERTKISLSTIIRQRFQGYYSEWNIPLCKMAGDLKYATSSAKTRKPRKTVEEERNISVVKQKF